MADDPEMREMVAEEAEAIRKRLPEAERALALRLLPRDAADARPAMLEIRAGPAGDAPALLAGDRFRMSQRYAEEHGRRVEHLVASPHEVARHKVAYPPVTGQRVTGEWNIETR